jgi:hypothetical protein
MNDGRAFVSPVDRNLEILNTRENFFRRVERCSQLDWRSA